MGFLPIRVYEDWVKIKKVKLPEPHKKCMYCKRVFNKNDYFIGNSRKSLFVCRTCAIPFLNTGLGETDTLKKLFQERLDEIGRAHV